MIRFRLATADDIPQIAPLERAASEAFREIGMDAVAEDDPIAESVLKAALQEKRLWVAAEFGTIRAYLLAEFLPESAHIEQVTVHPDASRRGLGAMLIEAISSDSRVKELGVITLTSFRDVPWNAPYYERIGFHTVSETEWPQGIAAKVKSEHSKGMAIWPRVVMMRTLEMPVA